MTLEEILAAKFGDDKEGLAAALTQAGKESKALTDSEVNGLKAKRDELLKSVTDLKKNQIPDNFDMNEYNALIKKKADMEQEAKDLEEKKLVQNEAWDTLKDKMNTTHTEALNKITKEKDDALADVTGAFYKEKKQTVAMKAIEAEKANSTLLLPHILPSLKVERDEDGKYSTIIVDSKGAPRLDDTTGDPFTMNQLISEFKANEAFAPAFPDQNSGSGQGARHKGAGSFNKGKNPFKKGVDWNLTEQAKLRKGNPDLAAAMEKSA